MHSVATELEEAELHGEDGGGEGGHKKEKKKKGHDHGHGHKHEHEHEHGEHEADHEYRFSHLEGSPALTFVRLLHTPCARALITRLSHSGPPSRSHHPHTEAGQGALYALRGARSRICHLRLRSRRTVHADEKYLTSPSELRPLSLTHDQ